MRKLLSSVALALLITPFHALAWDGYDYNNGTSVDIEKGNLVREGEEIEFFDYSAGEYRGGTVQEINRYGSSVEVVVEDSESGETRTLDMDAN